MKLNAHEMIQAVVDGMPLDAVLEMATPTDFEKNKTYYHGTSSLKAAKLIKKNGIQPPDLSNRKGFLRPVDDMIYLTPSIDYALIYALGADMAGHVMEPRLWGWIHEVSQYGFVFEVPGKLLVDVQPDEDSVGAMLGMALKGDTSIPYILTQLARAHLANSTLYRVADGEVAYQAKAGKVLLKRMTDKEKLLVLRAGAHVAHRGPIKPTRAWRVDKGLSQEFNRDGRNFFKVATLWK